MIYKVLIVEDEDHCYKSLKRLLDSREEFEIINLSQTIEGAIEAYNTFSPDLIFLDVELKDGNGFDFINAFENIETPIIFTTAHSTHDVRDFEEHAFHYLVKPILKSKFQDAIERFLALYAKSSLQISSKTKDQFQGEKIFLPTNSGKKGYSINSIESLRAKGSSSLVYLNTKDPLLITKPIKWFEDRLNFMPFMKVHRSYMVNINKITKISRGDFIEVTCEGGSTVEVSKQYKQAFLDTLKI
jgi:two-component system LytT family response regulator